MNPLEVLHKCWLAAEDREARYKLSRAFDYVYWITAGFTPVNLGPFWVWKPAHK